MKERKPSASSKIQSEKEFISMLQSFSHLSDDLLREEYQRTLDAQAKSWTYKPLPQSSALKDFQKLKEHVMSYHKPLYVNILFGYHFHNYGFLFKIATFDRDMFLHVVRYATRAAIDRSFLEISPDFLDFGYGSLIFLSGQYEYSPGLVLRPLFEKISQQAIDEAALQGGYAFSLAFRLLLKSPCIEDLEVLLKRISPEIIKKSPNKTSLIQALLGAHPRFVDYIVPHLIDETYAELEKGLLTQSISDPDTFFTVLPRGSKQHSCDPAAVRLIELMPKIPPIATLFRAYDCYHPLLKGIVMNPRLINAILRKCSDEDIKSIESILSDIFDYLDPDVVRKIYLLIPAFSCKEGLKHIESFTVNSISTYTASYLHPVFHYQSSNENFSYLKEKTQYVQEAFLLLPKNMCKEVCAIIFGYTAENILEANVMQTEIYSLFENTDLIASYHFIADNLKTDFPVKKPASQDATMLIMQYAIGNQHSFYLFFEEIKREKSKSWSSLLPFSFFNPIESLQSYLHPMQEDKKVIAHESNRKLLTP